jgi:hypothetical protein
MRIVRILAAQLADERSSALVALARKVRSVDVIVNGDGDAAVSESPTHLREDRLPA